MQADGGTWDVERLRSATTAAGCCLWSWNVVTDEIGLDEQACSLWGVASDKRVTFEMLSERIHPADLDRVRKAFEQTRGAPGPYEIDFRIRQADEVRWISARGQGGDAGIVNGTLFAVFMDVTSREAAEEARELLAGEMSHRVKNLFTIAGALTELTAKSAATTAEMARDLTRRFVALGRAHDLVRPLPGKRVQGVLLETLLTELLLPFADEGMSPDRVNVAVPHTTLGASASATLALIIHELATNSSKYGSLSALEGTLDLSGDLQGDDLVLRWVERGGPHVLAPPASRGFGGKLVSRSIAGQLGGRAQFDWHPAGLIATLTMSTARLTS